MSDSALTIAIDLRSEFGAVRSQGARPTCLAFAASGCHGYAIGGEAGELSVEYAFYHAVARTSEKDRTVGVNFGTMSATIADDGQPAESGWPYIPDLRPEDDWFPPENPVTIHRGQLDSISCDLGSVCNELRKQRPVLVIMDISRRFYYAAPDTIVNAPAGEGRQGTHAVIVVGFGDLDGAACYLIRNSWGSTWGAAGYAWLHEDYLEPRFLVAGVFSKEGLS